MTLPTPHSSEPVIIQKVALAVFKEGRIIMARNHNKTAFFNLGGKIEPGESDIDCLQREVMEEAAAHVDVSSLKFLAEFEAPPYNRPHDILRMRLYEGRLQDEPTPSAEVAELQYFDSSVDPHLLTPITRDHIFPWLKAQGLIN
jgi:8-oxo-dGTP diphosphatase